MSDLERLQEILETLPPQQVRALLTLLEANQPILDDNFARILADAPEEEVDDRTAARVLAAEHEPHPAIPHDEMKRRLGL